MIIAVFDGVIFWQLPSITVQHFKLTSLQGVINPIFQQTDLVACMLVRETNIEYSYQL